LVVFKRNIEIIKEIMQPMGLIAYKEP